MKLLVCSLISFCLVPFALQAQTPSTGSVALDLATRITQAPDDPTRGQALSAMAQALNIGIYTSAGQTVAAGGERGCMDFYLYDFEVKMLAWAEGAGRSPAAPSDVAKALNAMGVHPANRLLTGGDLITALAGAVRAAYQNPVDPAALPAMLIRELGRFQGYDLTTIDPATDTVTFDPVQQYLIALDATLPVLAQAAKPGIPLAVYFSGTPASTSASVCGAIGTQSNGRRWQAGRLAAQLTQPPISVDATAISTIPGAIIDGLHNEAISNSVRVTSLSPDQGPVHYGHGGPVDTMRFAVVAETMVQPDSTGPVQAGWLAGVQYPAIGPLAGVGVD